MLQPLDDLLALVWSARRKGLESFLLPTAALENGSLLARDSSLVSLFEIAGSRSLMGPDELESFVEAASRTWNTPLSRRGHALHVVFERDPAAASLARFCERQQRAGSSLGLELDDVLAERSARLAGLISEENVIVACWTRPSVLTGDQEKRDRKAMRRRLKDWLPRPSEAQCPLASFSSLAPRHEAFLAGVASGLGQAGIAHRPLSSAEAIRVLRRMTCGGGDAWHPATAVNEAPPRDADPPETGAFPPPLAPQILVEEPRADARHIVLGNRRYAALDMTLGPRVARPFSEFMAALADSGLACRWSLLVEGGGLSSISAATARIAAAFLAFSSRETMAVRDSLQALAAENAASRAVVRLRLTLLTWTPPDEPAGELARAVARLQQVLEGWGEIVATRLVGDPLETVAGTVPGFCCGGTAEPALAPLAEALRLMPFGRPAALAASRPNHLFHAPDGRMLPFSFEEGEDYGFDLIYGIPGRGKSVLMNSLALAWTLQSGQGELPLTAVIDIGPSSSGLVSLIREALPPDRRHEAGHFRLAMSKDHAINPFDTQLGCRTPLSAERQYLANLLALLLTPAGSTSVPDGARELIGPVIDEAYRMRSDIRAGSEPHAYTRGRDPAVDAVLERAAARLPERPTWWDVVDALFEAGESDAAARAQRFAVPVMSDLNAAVRAPAVQAIVGEATWGPGGETVTGAFTRILTGFAETWPILFHPTAFDTSGARIAAIDLKEVAPTGSAEADRQTAAVYMLARHALTRHWWIDEDAAAGIPERYRAWHHRRFRRIREAPKRICFDEFHRTAAAPSVVAQIERDVRETRKLRVTVTLASQRVEDFGPALVELANRIWVLGAGGKRTEVETLASIFSLSATLEDAVRNQLTGPDADGAPALLMAADGRGRLEQVVVNSPGPAELWALTTSPRDVALRERLYRRLPPAAARAALAQAFPSGTAAAAIEAALARDEGAGRASERETLDRLAADLASRALHPGGPAFRPPGGDHA